ncbi:MAG: hypothetical protein K2P93_04765 [Alphaproteobacteria bacterium]|nr:hypothetical protein [Alphaproteobacteria bacterium]
MKKYILLSLVGFMIFSSESYGGRFKKATAHEEKKGPQIYRKITFKDQLRVGDQEWMHYKMLRLVKRGRPGGFSPHGDHLSDLLNGNISRKKTLYLTRGTTFYILATSRWFRKNMTLPLLLQEGRENGQTPQVLRVPLLNEPKRDHPLLTRGNTIYIPETSDRF